MLKQCTKCNEEKPLEEFALNKLGKMGRHSRCRACKNESNRERWKFVTEEQRVKKRASSKSSRQRNLAHYAEKESRRRLRTKEQTPAWNDKLVMRMIYEDCPEGHQVDHIVPLNGDTVSGLHVHYNLQWLPAKENQRKSNKWL